MSRTDKKRKRRLPPLVFLSAVLLLAAAFVLLLPRIKAWFPAKDTQTQAYEPTYKTIAQRDSQTLESITVTHLGKEPYTLVIENGKLALRSASGQIEPVDSMVAANFLKYAATISVEDTVAQDVGEVLENLPDMGLSPPQITVDTAYADGSADTFWIGYNLPSTSYYYYRWSGDDGVYVCNSGIYDTFSYTADMLLEITQPSIIPSLIERVSILQTDGEPIVCAFTTEGDTVTGALQSPFAYPMSAEASENMLNAVENFRLGARLQAATDETRAAYGLDSPQVTVKIGQREGLYSITDSQGVMQTYPLASSTITLAIGAADGEFFYFCEYEGTCYRVSAFLVTAFLHADAADTLSLTPADMGTEPMQSVVVQTGSGTLNFFASFTEEVLPNNELKTDENGDVVYTEEVTANGETISTAAFDALVLRLRQMTVSGKLDTVEAPGETPLWQMTLTTTQGKTRTLAAYPLDAFSDVLAVDGVAVHTISKEALEIALGEFAALPEATLQP